MAKGVYITIHSGREQIFGIIMNTASIYVRQPRSKIYSFYITAL